MFPLGTVLVPGAVLPLQVFEPRYLALVEHCLSRDGEFGVVLIERGHEVGGGDVRTDVGTVARIVEARQLDGRRWALLARGERRLRVSRWLADEPFPRAEVQDWPDPPATTQDLARLPTTVATLRRALALHAELGRPGPPATVELADDPLVAGYQALALAPISTFDRHRLLGAASQGERLAGLHELLEEHCGVFEAELGR